MVSAWTLCLRRLRRSRKGADSPGPGQASAVTWPGLRTVFTGDSGAPSDLGLCSLGALDQA